MGLDFNIFGEDNDIQSIVELNMDELNVLVEHLGGVQNRERLEGESNKRVSHQRKCGQIAEN